MYTREITGDLDVSEIYAEVTEILGKHGEHDYEIAGEIEVTSENYFSIEINNRVYEVEPGKVRASNWMNTNNPAARELQSYLREISEKLEPDQNFHFETVPEDQKIRPGDR